MTTKRTLRVSGFTKDIEHLATRNCVLLSPRTHSILSNFVLIRNQILNARAFSGVSDDTIMLHGIHRTQLGVSLTDTLEVEKHKVDTQKIIQQMEVCITYLNDTNNFMDTMRKYTAGMLDPLIEEMNECLMDTITSYIIRYDKIVFKMRIMNIRILDIYLISNLKKDGSIFKMSQEGIFQKGTTQIIYSTEGPLAIELDSSLKSASIFKFNNIDYERLGIGGVDQQFGEMFRRVFASRILHPDLVKKLGLKHQKGIILYGPPGTGKTLLARSLCKVLNSREPKIVNGPEILNKYVGQSEENVRLLFKEAEDEYRAKGDSSDLHVIIFDEIDSICRQRGTDGNGTNVSSSVVNQLLTKIDGVNSLNNILIIGMTNRIDLIDSAMLRPGRFGYHLEISLPDEEGRYQIFKIHTAKLREGQFLDESIDLRQLANLTKNYTGAEIEAVIKDASSYAIRRDVDLNNLTTNIKTLSSKVTSDDFDHAIRSTKTAFGLSEDEFTVADVSKIIGYGPKYSSIMNELRTLVDQLKVSQYLNLISVLISGESGCGKSTIASKIALNSDLSFAKSISPDKLLSLYREEAKCSSITQTFYDSYKSPCSFILLDDLERLIEYVPIGPRFSNALLQTIMILLTKKPPLGSKLMIIATTSSIEVMERLDMVRLFNTHIRVDNLGPDEITYFLEARGKSTTHLEHLPQDISIRDLLVFIDRL